MRLFKSIRMLYIISLYRHYSQYFSALFMIFQVPGFKAPKLHFITSYLRTLKIPMFLCYLHHYKLYAFCTLNVILDLLIPVVISGSGRDTVGERMLEGCGAEPSQQVLSLHLPDRKNSVKNVQGYISSMNFPGNVTSCELLEKCYK